MLMLFSRRAPSSNATWRQIPARGVRPTHAPGSGRLRGRLQLPLRQMSTYRLVLCACTETNVNLQTCTVCMHWDKCQLTDLYCVHALRHMSTYRLVLCSCTETNVNLQTYTVCMHWDKCQLTDLYCVHALRQMSTYRLVLCACTETNFYSQSLVSKFFGLSSRWKPTQKFVIHWNIETKIHSLQAESAVTAINVSWLQYLFHILYFL